MKLNRSDAVQLEAYGLRASLSRSATGDAAPGAGGATEDTGPRREGNVYSVVELLNAGGHVLIREAAVAGSLSETDLAARAVARLNRVRGEHFAGLSDSDFRNACAQDSSAVANAAAKQSAAAVVRSRSGRVSSK